MKYVLKPLAKSLFILLGLTAVALAIDAVIHKKMFESSMTMLIISNEEMNDIMKIVTSLAKQLKKKEKNKKDNFSVCFRYIRG